MSRASTHRRRRDLRLLVVDGSCYSMMTGAGEWQFVLFALALGMGEVASGLVATIPVFIGAVLQLITPWGARRAGSLRRWTSTCAAVQACSIVPLVIGAWYGAMPPWLLYTTIAVYWASGYMTAPTWQTWFTTLVPRAIRAEFWARRSRWVQVALATGLAAGFILQEGEAMGRPLEAFAVVFSIAVVVRCISTWCLRSQSEPKPELALEIEPPTPKVLRRFLADARTRGLLGYMLAFFLCVFVTAPFFGPYMREQLGFEYWQIICVQLGTFGSKIVFLPLVGRMTRTLGPGRVLWIGALMTLPAALLWLFVEPWWLLVIFQVYVGFGWACWENGSFLLVFDTIPESRRTPIMTVYQLLLATVMVGGSLLGGAVLDVVGTTSSGYATIFVLTTGMRVVTLFLLASIEPSGLRLRHRTKTLVVRTAAAIPGLPSFDVDVIESDERDPPG